MSWKMAKVGLAAILAVCLWAEAATTQTVPPKPAVKKAAKIKKASTPKQETPAAAISSPQHAAPPEPATLGNSAPVKPSVTMQSGLLTIDAPNSTLSDVLSGVHKATGASIEGISPSDRVAVKLGPGSPEQVIAALLHGTPYDYVILGAPGRRDVVTRVLISSAIPGSDEGSRGLPAPGRPARGNEHPANDENSFAGQADVEPEPVQQPMVNPRGPQPGASPEETEEQQQRQQLQQQEPQQQQQQQPKTVEELFRQLQILRAPQQEQPQQ